MFIICMLIKCYIKNNFSISTYLQKSTPIYKTKLIMKLNLILILLSVLSYSCISTKTTQLNDFTETHFALEDHSFEESCVYFDSCHRATHPELYEKALTSRVK